MPCRPRDPVRTQAPTARLQHQLLDLADRLRRVQALRAGARAVHDGVAAVQLERIFQVVQARAGVLVARIDDPAVGLQQDRRAEVTLAVPPVARATGRAAGAQDAFVQAVELLAVGRRLQALAVRRRRALRAQPRLDRGVLRIEMRHVRHQVLHHRHVRQRIDRHLALARNRRSPWCRPACWCRRCSSRTNRRCPRGRNGGRSASGRSRS